jgi:ketosteroid isomerase-like protein
VWFVGDSDFRSMELAGYHPVHLFKRSLYGQEDDVRKWRGAGCGPGTGWCSQSGRCTAHRGDDGTGERLVIAFNGEQGKTPDVFTPDCVVFDEFAPFVWRGQQEEDAWYAKLANSMQDPKDGHWRVKTFAPKSQQTKGDLAYFVVPAEPNYKKDGKAHVQHGSWLFVVMESGEHWKIAAHSWAIESDVLQN